MMRRYGSLALALLVSGCALTHDAIDDAGGPVPVDGGVTFPDAMPIAPDTQCSVALVDAVGQTGGHVDPCTPIGYPTSPPMGGTHYSVWAAFRAYDAPVPHGFLVHAMEHGAVVLYHRCLPSECPDLVADLRDIADTTDADPSCSSTLARNRIIVVPDPTLDVPVAASSWGHSYKATCFDEPSLRAFIAAHYAMGTENFCSAGVNRSADGGVWCDPAVP